MVDEKALFLQAAKLPVRSPITIKKGFNSNIIVRPTKDMYKENPEIKLRKDLAIDQKTLLVESLQAPKHNRTLKRQSSSETVISCSDSAPSMNQVLREKLERNLQSENRAKVLKRLSDTRKYKYGMTTKDKSLKLRDTLPAGSTVHQWSESPKTIDPAAMTSTSKKTSYQTFKTAIPMSDDISADDNGNLNSRIVVKEVSASKMLTVRLQDEITPLKTPLYTPATFRTPKKGRNKRYGSFAAMELLDANNPQFQAPTTTLSDPGGVDAPKSEQSMEGDSYKDSRKEHFFQAAIVQSGDQAEAEEEPEEEPPEGEGQAEEEDSLNRSNSSASVPHSDESLNKPSFSASATLNAAAQSLGQGLMRDPSGVNLETSGKEANKRAARLAAADQEMLMRDIREQRAMVLEETAATLRKAEGSPSKFVFRHDPANSDAPKVKCMKCLTEEASLWCKECSCGYCGKCWMRVPHHVRGPKTPGQAPNYQASAVHNFRFRGTPGSPSPKTFSNTILFQAYPADPETEPEARVKKFQDDPFHMDAPAAAPRTEHIVEQYQDYPLPPVYIDGEGNIFDLNDYSRYVLRPNTHPYPGDVRYSPFAPKNEIFFRQSRIQSGKNNIFNSGRLKSLVGRNTAATRPGTAPTSPEPEVSIEVLQLLERQDQLDEAKQQELHEYERSLYLHNTIPYTGTSPKIKRNCSRKKKHLFVPPLLNAVIAPLLKFQEPRENVILKKFPKEPEGSLAPAFTAGEGGVSAGHGTLASTKAQLVNHANIFTDEDGMQYTMGPALTPVDVNQHLETWKAGEFSLFAGPAADFTRTGPGMEGATGNKKAGHRTEKVEEEGRQSLRQHRGELQYFSRQAVFTRNNKEYESLYEEDKKKRQLTDENFVEPPPPFSAIRS